jgi:hypothetical protein
VQIGADADDELAFDAAAHELISAMPLRDEASPNVCFGMQSA